MTNIRPIKLAIYENDKLIKENNHYYTNKSKRLFINQEERIRGIIRDSAFPYAFQYHNNDLAFQKSSPFVNVDDTIFWGISSRSIDDNRFRKSIIYNNTIKIYECRVHNYAGENSLWKVYNDSIYEQIDTLTSFRTDSIEQNNHFSYLIDTNLFQNRRLTDPKQLYYHPKRKTLFALCDNNYNDTHESSVNLDGKLIYNPEIIEYNYLTKKIIQRIQLPESKKRVFYKHLYTYPEELELDLVISNFAIKDSLLYLCFRNNKIDGFGVFNLYTLKWDSFLNINNLSSDKMNQVLLLKGPVNYDRFDRLYSYRYTSRFKIFSSLSGNIYISEKNGHLFHFKNNKFDTVCINKYNIEKDSGFFPYYSQRMFFADGFENIYLSSNLDGKLYKFNPKSKSLDVLIDSFVFENKLQKDYSPMDYTFDCDANLLGYFYKTKWYKDSFHYFYRLPDSNIRAAHYKYFSEINTRFKFVKNPLKDYR
ncbi:MAG: hypothetical protein MUE72_13295, partial [Chitinophagaceae bacterium]|nr:hypothetical protein [Chitinophagaceae bacterium]